MIVFPNCKVNLGLQILGKRPDGYHDLETVFYPIAYHDILEFVPATAFQFSSTGLTIGSDPSSNLCVRAYHMLKQSFPEMPAVKMHLHKVVPMGAGLGGGSADGSYTLKALNDYFQLGLSTEELINLSLKLGSDCPFFIHDRPVIARGRGEIMEVIDLDLSAYTIAIIHPGIHISTAKAFSGVVPRGQSRGLRSLVSEPVSEWKNRMVNDFETTVFAHFPEIGKIKNLLYELGAVYASMTGSGSAVYGLFPQPPALPLQPSWKLIQVPLK
jgi:4-diphosphocytidyl-2-C-methyl-D-erythritol kinase